jgi:hypothetical protein
MLRAMTEVVTREMPRFRIEELLRNRVFRAILFPPIAMSTNLSLKANHKATFAFPIITRHERDAGDQ